MIRGRTLKSMTSEQPASGGTELGRFLRARRARITPVEAGLATGPVPRRTPGLRREELATLAGISTDYYTRLERGDEADALGVKGAAWREGRWRARRPSQEAIPTVPALRLHATACMSLPIAAVRRDLGRRLRRGEEVVGQRRGARSHHREAHLVGREFRDGYVADVRT